MAATIESAMILAAGLGTRMRPLTNERPKPLVEVGGKALVDWVLDDLAAAGIEKAVINLHYKADMMRAHLATRSHPSITLSDETEALLDTGGGVAAALSVIVDDVFLVTNSDALWQGGLAPAIGALKQAWSQDCDALLLLADMNKAFGFDGAGDFFLGEDGTPARRGGNASAPTAYAGTQLIHRRILDNNPGGTFSFNQLWDAAIERGTLKAIMHDDDWYHVGTPDAVGPTSRALTMGLAAP